jgi:hypothetical protein
LRLAQHAFRRRQPACVFCRRDVWHSGFPQACWRLPTRASGRNHRRQIAHGFNEFGKTVRIQEAETQFISGPASSNTVETVR